MYNLEKEIDLYFCLGKFIKTFGYKGELVLFLDTDNPDLYEDLEVLFVNMEGSLVPWFIEMIEVKEKLANIRLERITVPDQARDFIKKDVYLPIEKLGELEGKDFYFHEIIGFEVKDKTHGAIGIVEEVLDRPEQEIIRIVHGKKEILIPLTNQLIRKVDRKKKILHLDTPEGLIDIYL